MCMEKSVIIIGSGLGGLQCGYILAKEGYQVTILEKEDHVGGCLEFGSGFHYVGALGPDQPLNKLFKYFNLLNLPWHQLDPHGFDEVIYEGESFMFANGPDAGEDRLANDQFNYFSDVMAEKFPSSYSRLRSYSSFLREVAKNTMDGEPMPLLERSAYQYLYQQFAGNSKLINVLSGTSINMDLCRERLPLYTFAQINSSHIQSSWKLQGSASQITASLAGSIIEMGGNIMTGCEVTRLYETNGVISEVQINGADRLQADIIISDTHPAITLSLLPESSVIKNVYKKKMTALMDTHGMFSVGITLKKDQVKYLNRNVFIHEHDVWDHSEGIMVSFSVPEDGSVYANHIDILAPINWDEFTPRKGYPVQKSEEELNILKHAKAQECIRKACSHFSDLKKNIVSYTITTPLNGSYYNIKKDWKKASYTLLSPKTPVSNLFFTGQNLNLHGILGVSMTSYMTCSEVFKTKRALKNTKAVSI